MPNEASSKSGKPARKSGDNPGTDLHQKVSYLPDIHRLLPQAPDAEQGVLSSFLLAPRDVGGRCVERQINPEHFHLPAHAQIYATLVELWNANQPIDFITLTQILRDRKQLDQVGGSAFITHLFTFLPTAANVGYYIGILEEKFTLREIIKVCTEFASRGYDEQDDVPSLLNDVEAKIFGIAQDRLKEKTLDLQAQLMLAIKSIEELYNRRGGITGLPTGFTEFDKMTDGLHPGEMVVIAARPSMGKTALAMNIAEHVALEAKQPVAVFSLEMSSSQLVQRLLCSRARVNLANVRNGFLQNSDFTALTAAASKLAESKMFIDDSHDLSILELKAKCRRMKAQHNIQAIFIDYLQLLRSSSRRAQDNRQLEIAEISSGVKGLAKELNVPIVVLAQLNRNPEGRTGESKGRPRLSDLRESGSIEQDADLVGLLVREEYYADSDEEKEKVEGKATLIIAKQRNGPVGDVPLTFLKEHTRFENRARESEAEE
ncbi:MAG TPA: replicative DNA helicase [Chthoniobacter sp.]|jgi:replicative DNA helicase